MKKGMSYVIPIVPDPPEEEQMIAYGGGTPDGPFLIFELQGGSWIDDPTVYGGRADTTLKLPEGKSVTKITATSDIAPGLGKSFSLRLWVNGAGVRETLTISDDSNSGSQTLTPYTAGPNDLAAISLNFDEGLASTRLTYTITIE